MIASTDRQPGACSYRRPLEGAGENTVWYCTLAKTICGAKDARLFAVRKDECAACCRMNVPAVTRPNGMVASVLRKALDHIKAAGGVDGCSAAHAEKLIPFASRHLLVAHDAGEGRGYVLRERHVRPCRHLGAPQGKRLCRTCSGTVWLKVFACHHPAHEDTVIRECMICEDYEEAPASPPDKPQASASGASGVR